MASKYQEQERQRQIKLLTETSVFNNDRGGGCFRGCDREFMLLNGVNNFYPPIAMDAQYFFAENNISWWQGSKPTGHILSSQMACLNHLFAVKDDKSVVLAILNSVRNEFIEVLPIPYDKKPQSYISFEVVSGEDYLNEKQSTRGSQCTSVDAFIYARHKTGELWLIPIEWKYTEYYTNQDKSTEDRPGAENINGKGNERLGRYSELINDSEQLRTLPEYKGSIYFQEPFYQLMRQTLWAEQIIRHKDSPKELLKADNYLHIHVVPSRNEDLLHRKYRVSGNGMEYSWRDCLRDQTKYVIIDPLELMKSITDIYPSLIAYLKIRYWNTK
ncbi:hypothetical protein [Bacteroides sp.]|uniref:PGN_0703 family putative restriction endonuclease n=1 Tax=Bacteroides sp. TaxID=29523 RepID=UPI002FC95238